MRLAATALREFWDERDENLVLGPWGVPLARKAEWQTYRLQRAPDPWEDREALHRACRRAQDIFEELIDPLGQRLDEIHALRHSRRYWLILAGPWLSRFVHLVYDRFERLRLAWERYPKLEAVLLDDADFQTPEASLHFQNLGFTDAYNQQVFSELIALERPDLPRRRLACPPEPCPPPDPYSCAAFKALDRLIRLRSPRILVSQLFHSRRDQYRLLAGLKTAAAPFYGSLPPPPPPDINLRERLKGLTAQGPVASAIARLIPRHLPTLYLEGYRAAREATLSGWRRAPKALASSTGWLFNEALKFAGAEFSERGAVLAGWQHGGGYGLDADTPSEHLERSLCDRFATWGWASANGGAPAVPLPSPLTQRFQAAGLSAKADSELLFVTNGFPLYPYLLYNWPMGWRIEENLEWQRRLLLALKGPARESLRVRLYPLERGWRQRERLQEGLAPLRFDDGRGSFEKALSRARLVVFDHIGTSFLEAIAFGAPCLAFVNPGVNRFRQEASEAVAKLSRAAMLLESPEAAAKACSHLFADPSRWWEHPATREARDFWSHRYAGLGEPWPGPWRKFLRELAQ